MSELDITSLLPMLILAVGIMFTMLLVAVKRNHILTFFCTLIVLLASFISILFIKVEAPHAIGELFLIDRFGLYFQALILLATLAITIFSYISILNFFPEKRKEEYYLLLMLATLGSATMVISTHFISFFVSLEVLNVSLYTLISYYRERTTAIEAGLKYLILAAMSSAFLLFGMALIYAITGTMSFHPLASIITTLNTTDTIMMLIGIGLMIVGIGFKLGLVPFHMWTPDVYEGASSPISSFIATVSKGAMVAVLLRFFIMANLYRFEKIIMVFTGIAILSMLIGNLLALLQNNIKRIFAYSSIAHFGYVLVALISGKELGPPAAIFYITAYTITILGAFGLITIISKSDGETTDINSYQGLFWRHPVLAAIFTVVLLSLAGIPLTAGFMGKYFLLTAGVGQGKWLLAITLVISSVIGLYYYLRLINMMMKQNDDATSNSNLSKILSISGGLVLAILGFLVIWLGVSPNWLIDLVNRLLTSLTS